MDGHVWKPTFATMPVTSPSGSGVGASWVNDSSNVMRAPGSTHTRWGAASSKLRSCADAGPVAPPSNAPAPSAFRTVRLFGWNGPDGFGDLVVHTTALRRSAWSYGSRDPGIVRVTASTRDLLRWTALIGWPLSDPRDSTLNREWFVRKMGISR